MVERIPHRDLRHDSARVLREVAAGGVFEITNHGEVVAVLSPPQSSPPPLTVRPARRVGGFSDLPLPEAPEPSRVAIDALREDR